jgi:hypothetical protein
MREIDTQIDIAAPAERVWQVLTDFASYPQWNPFLRQVSGEAKVGARLDVRAQPPGGQPRTFQATVQRLEPNRELAWMGRLLMPGLFTGVHSFDLESLGPAHVRLHHRERFTGLLVPLVLGRLGTTIRQGFEEMNRALQARAEGKPSG